MSIPLDRLYHYIEHIAKKVYKDNLVIYRFYPHGSKKIEDLTTLHTYTQKDLIMNPLLYVHDQEPLNYELYNNVELYQTNFTRLVEKYQLKFPAFNFQQHGCRYNIYDNSLLIHSEQRSSQVIKYQDNNFIPVYYWAHALIARDWFRYAQHQEPVKKNYKTFLIYNRAWAGTREYRLKFADLLIDHNLLELCKTTVNSVDPQTNMHYKQHNFVNELFRPGNELEKFFTPSHASSAYSADFQIEDYENCLVEVVLETLFDDSRLHLTEKILRPIACGQPFILAGTQGSLEYLKSYGFKTFSSVWDESYDSIENPVDRLNQIINLMKQISQWDPDARDQKMQEAQKIAQYNKKHFFSDEFFCHIVTELEKNLQAGLQELETTNTSKIWFDRRKTLYSIPEIRDTFHHRTAATSWNDNIKIKSRQDFVDIVGKARKYYQRNGHSQT